MFLLATIDKLGLIQNLAAVMMAAGLVAALFYRIGWPKVIGYIVAGALMALSAPVKAFLVPNEDSISVLANLGIIFLMFTLGLELNLRKLRSAGGVIFPTATFDLLMMLIGGYFVGRYIFNWSLLPSLFLGAMLCDSSTTLLAKSLEEMGCSKENFASIIFGITISEDVLTIGVMAVLTGLSATGEFQTKELLINMHSLILFLISILIFGLMLLPRCLDRMKEFKDDETLLIAILGICFGVSFFAEKLQYSLALGAFLVGAVVAHSSVSSRVHASMVPLRNMFSAVFFVTIGLMIRPVELWSNIVKIIFLTLFVFVGKTINCTFMSFLMGQPYKDALKTGIGMAQIGDFSYLIAMMGLTLNNGETPYSEMYQIAVGTSVLTTLLNPFLLKASIPLCEYLDRKMPAALLNALQNYTSWICRAGKNIKKDSNWRQIRNGLVIYAIHHILMVSLFVVARYIDNQRDLWITLPGFVSRHHTMLLWIAACVSSFFIILSAFLCNRSLARDMTNAIIPALPNKRLQQSLFHLIWLCIMAISMVLMVLSFASCSTWFGRREKWVICIVFGLFIAVCLLCWKRVKRIALNGQHTLQLVLEHEDELSFEDAAPQEKGKYHTIRIQDDSGAIGLSLAQLHLRNRTGATIARIRRHNGTTIHNPEATLQIEKGDILQLAANDEQLAAAKTLLSSQKIEFSGIDTISGFFELTVESICLSEKASSLGKTLKELRIRNVSGTTVVRVVRVDGKSFDNPGPDLTLAYADHVFLLGTKQQIDIGFRYLEQGTLEVTADA